MGSVIPWEFHLKQEDGKKKGMEIKNEEVSWSWGREGKRTKPLPLLSGSEVDCCFYMVHLTSKSSSSPHSCVPAHDHKYIPSHSSLSLFCHLSASLEFSFPALLQLGSPRKSFCTWPIPSGVVRLLYIMLKQQESALSTGRLRHYTKVIWKKKIIKRCYICLVYFSKPWVIPCLHESFILGLYEQTQGRQLCFKQLLWTK